MQRRLQLIFLLFTLINVGDNQLFAGMKRVLNIEITPTDVIMNSTDTANFLCINHQSNDSELETSVPNSIPSNQIKISTIFSNKTTKQIQLQTNNYVGCFHLLCYAKGQRLKSIYADITVIGALNDLQRIGKCEVHERQYIKCMIRAPTIAKAIQNGCSERFEFEEINHSSNEKVYNKYEFMKNESTNEILVIKWKPTLEREFPSGLLMRMTQTLRHFKPSYYIFDMTPVFLIKPKFILKVISSNKIQINVTSVSPPAVCERSIVPSSAPMDNRTWTIIEQGRDSILMDQLLSSTTYRVCIRCRQVYDDPQGLEECQEMKTSRDSPLPIIVAASLIIGLLIILGLIGSFIVVKRRRPNYLGKNQHIPCVIDNRYERDLGNASTANISLQIEDNASAIMLTHEASEETELANGSEIEYLPIANPEEYLNASNPPVLNPSER